MKIGAVAEFNSIFLDFSTTRRERPKSALYLRLKIVKGELLGFVKFHLVAKYENKLKGDSSESIKNFRKKLLK